MQITEIDISLIKPSGENPRKKFKNIGNLAKNIQKNGLINPISVEKQGNTYILIAGERRFHAMKFLKWKQAPCIVRKKTKYDMLAENFCREDLGVVEEAQAIHKVLYEEFGNQYPRMLTRVHNKDFDELKEDEKKVSDICQSIGFTAGYIYRIIGMLKLDKETQELIIEREIPDSAALKISELRTPGSQEQIKKFLQQKEIHPQAIVHEVNRLKFMENKGITDKSVEVKELFSALHNFSRGSAQLKSCIPVIVRFNSSLKQKDKKLLQRNLYAIRVFLEGLESKEFQNNVRKNKDFLNELESVLDE